MNALNFLLLLIVSILALGLPIAAGVLVYRLAFRGHAGGWSKLAERFPAPPGGPKPFRHGATVQVGLVSHKRSIALAASAEGLWLRNELPGFGRAFPALLIPWGEFRESKDTWYFGSRGYRIAIGSPTLSTITMTKALFGEIQRAREATRSPARPAEAASAPSAPSPEVRVPIPSDGAPDQPEVAPFALAHHRLALAEDQPAGVLVLRIEPDPGLEAWARSIGPEAGAEALLQEIDVFAGSLRTPIILDARSLDHLGAPVVSLLSALHRQVHRGGGHLAVCLNEHVDQFFQHLRFGETIPAHRSMSEALASVRAKQVGSGS